YSNSMEGLTAPAQVYRTDGMVTEIIGSPSMVRGIARRGQLVYGHCRLRYAAGERPPGLPAKVSVRLRLSAVMRAFVGVSRRLFGERLLIRLTLAQRGQQFSVWANEIDGVAGAEQGIAARVQPDRGILSGDR